MKSTKIASRHEYQKQKVNLIYLHKNYPFPYTARSLITTNLHYGQGGLIDDFDDEGATIVCGGEAGAAVEKNLISISRWPLGDVMISDDTCNVDHSSDVDGNGIVGESQTEPAGSQ